MLGLMPVAQRSERVVLGPGVEALGMHLRRSRRADRVVQIGKVAVMAELRFQPLDDIEDLVPVDREVDLQRLVREVAQLAEKYAPAIILADARSPELLEALALQPEQVGPQAAARRAPVGADHFGLARPERRGDADEALDIGGDHGAQMGEWTRKSSRKSSPGWARRSAS